VKIPYLNGSNSFQAPINLVIDGNDDQIAYSFIGDGGSVTSCIVVSSGQTGSPDDLECMIQGNSGGKPDGTDVGGGSPTLVTVDQATWPASGTSHTFTFTNAFTTTSGTKYWIVFRGVTSPTPTFSASNRYLLQGLSNVALQGAPGNTYCFSTDRGVSYGETSDSGPSFGVTSGGARMALHTQSIITSTAQQLSVNSSDNPDEYGMQITVPTNEVFTCTGITFKARFSTLDSNRALDVSLYVGTTLKETVTLQSNVDNNEVNNTTTYYVQFLSAYTLNAGDVCNFTLRSTGTSDVQITQIVYPSAAEKDLAWGGMFDECTGIQRNGGTGSFDNTTAPNTMYHIIPIGTVTAAGGGGGGGLRLAGRGGLAG